MATTRCGRVARGDTVRQVPYASRDATQPDDLVGASAKKTGLTFRFESAATGYAPVLGDPPAGVGRIASQNAGSTNTGLYYQVGGSGVNGRFGSALAAAGQIDAANSSLIAAYDSVYDAADNQPGAYTRDSSSGRTDRLVSLLVPLEPAPPHVGEHVVAMIYSVGPMLEADGITDETGYRKLYYQAYEQIAAYNRSQANPIVGLRVTMLSTGIYASRVDDADVLLATSARNIVLGLAHAAVDCGMPDTGFTVLINHELGSSNPPKERTAFATAMKALGMPMSDGASSFTVDFDLLESHR